MGVIHKFKEPVVSYVLQQKRDNINLSCRQLAVLTSERFQLPISKSAVNNVIKHAQLSSPVGRRPLSHPSPKKFQIPFTIKENLLKSLPALDLDEKEMEAVNDQAPKIEVDQSLLEWQKSFSQTPLEHSLAIQSVEEKPKPEVVIEQTLIKDNFMEQVRLAREKRAVLSGQIYEGMGFIFLKAAEWEKFSKPVLEVLFSKYIGQYLPENFCGFCEAVMAFRLLGVKTLEEIDRYPDHALWIMNGFNQKPDVGRYYQLLNTIQVPQILLSEYRNEVQQASIMVDRFRLALEEGQDILIDAQISSMWGKQLQSKSWPFHRAMTILSNSLIANNHMAVFHSFRDEDVYSSSINELLMAFDNLPGKKIKKIVLEDENGEEITNFSTLLNKKRDLIFGVWSFQNHFAKWVSIQGSPDIKPFYDDIGDRIFNYAEIESDMGGQISNKDNFLRGILIWKEGEKEPFGALLTNNKTFKGIEVFRTYIKRWPLLEKGYDLRQSRANGDQNGENHGNLAGNQQVSKIMFESTGETFVSLTDLIYDFVQDLEEYIGHNFLLKNIKNNYINNFISIGYNLSGSLNKLEGYVEVKLLIAKTLKFYLELECLARTINERFIFDHSGKKIYIELTNN